MHSHSQGIKWIWCGHIQIKPIFFLLSIIEVPHSSIYIIISKNTRYLLWNRGARRFFHDTYLTIEVQGIRCTNHLHDSCPLTDVNPHFTAPGCRYYFKINSWWPIVTSSTHGPAASYCDVTMIHCSHGYLWTHDVEVDASQTFKGIASTRRERWLGSGGWKVEIIQTINS